ncbi:acyl carrier protein [Kitasatospora sp. NPDC089913]|uniref:acyl carrier protein n=1 Tax=Streptomycetaceae TaxID=2062 RepID=UPI0008792161|nr:acyl carrier protein [Streptomyces sp. TLI_053]SDT83255.1 nonribosomal peptide synthetase protein VioA [Streptomyces sp. TLI_053]
MDTTRSAPSTPEALRSAVRDAWATVLQHDEFTDTDPFFSVGGTSLLGAQLTAVLGAGLGRRVPVRLLIAHPTVEELAAALTP